MICGSKPCGQGRESGQGKMFFQAFHRQVSPPRVAERCPTVSHDMLEGELWRSGAVCDRCDVDEPSSEGEKESRALLTLLLFSCFVQRHSFPSGGNAD